MPKETTDSNYGERVRNIIAPIPFPHSQNALGLCRVTNVSKLFLKVSVVKHFSFLYQLWFQLGQSIWQIHCAVFDGQNKNAVLVSGTD
jgi:hypothetical protein